MPGADVAKRIRLIRQRLGLTQGQFSKAIGVSRLSVARYEAGRLPRADVLDQISRLGDVTVTWLLHGTEKGEPPRSDSSSSSEIARAAAQPIAEALSGPLAARLGQLPRRYRDRYDRRVGEVVARFRRELEEYVELLRLEYLARRRRRRS